MLGLGYRSSAATLGTLPVTGAARVAKRDQTGRRPCEKRIGMPSNGVWIGKALPLPEHDGWKMMTASN